MAELKENKRRLSINLSLFGHNDQNTKTITKSPRNFEEPNGVVGLGIVAALHDTDQIHDPFFSVKSSRAAISPRSNPIPVINKTMSFDSSKFETFGRNTFGEVEDMELAEEYTCVISHIGKNVIKKREYFDGDLGNGSTRTSSCWVKTGLFSASSPQASIQYDEAEVFHGADFLNSCYLCKKQLHGLDIFMYRGEKAFCSAECRHKQILIDERQGKHNNSGVMKPLECSVSPCSSPIQYFAGVAMG